MGQEFWFLLKSGIIFFDESMMTENQRLEAKKITAPIRQHESENTVLFTDYKEGIIEYREIEKDPQKTKVDEVYEWFYNQKSAIEKFNSLTFENIDEYRELKRDALKEQCTAAIHAGFKSASLEKEFGFNEHDQSNFTQQLLLIVASGGQYTNPIAWKSLDGAVNTLTTKQFNTLVQEATAHKVAQQQAYWLLESRLNEATTKEEIIAIEWQVST